jgi:hypothetical protein
MEMYFRTRWFYTDRIVFISKAKPTDKCHLKIQFEGGIETKSMGTINDLKLKFTKTCKPNIRKNVDGKEDFNGVMYFPMSNDEYRKQWGHIDLIVTELQNKSGYISEVYYIDSQRLLKVLDELSEIGMFEDKHSNRYFTRDYFKYGISVEDMSNVFGLIVSVDRVFWKNKNFLIKGSKIPYPKYMEGRRNCQFITEWDTKPEFKKLYWKNFTLRGSSDQSKPVVVQNIKTKKSMIFPSVTSAVVSLSESVGKKITPSSFYNLLTGRQKSVITPKGRLTAWYYYGKSSEEVREELLKNQKTG